MRVLGMFNLADTSALLCVFSVITTVQSYTKSIRGAHVYKKLGAMSFDQLAAISTCKKSFFLFGERG